MMSKDDKIFVIGLVCFSILLTLIFLISSITSASANTGYQTGYGLL